MILVVGTHEIKYKPVVIAKRNAGIGGNTLSNGGIQSDSERRNLPYPLMPPDRQSRSEPTADFIGLTGKANKVVITDQPDVCRQPVCQTTRLNICPDSSSRLTQRQRQVAPSSSRTMPSSGQRCGSHNAVLKFY